MFVNYLNTEGFGSILALFSAVQRLFVPALLVFAVNLQMLPVRSHKGIAHSTENSFDIIVLASSA